MERLIISYKEIMRLRSTSGILDERSWVDSLRIIAAKDVELVGESCEK
jgi:hypothetical protein